MSNNCPPKGEISALKDYSEKNGGYPCTMDFIGFGSGDFINTEIGYPLANITGGRGYYISDGSMIGNVFSSLIGLLLSCLDFNSKLYFSIDNLVEKDTFKIFNFDKLFRAGYNPEKIDDCTISIQTGPLIYGTTRHFSIPIRVPFEEKDIKISLVNGSNVIESTINNINNISFWKEMNIKNDFIDVLALGFYYMTRGNFDDARKKLEKFEENNPIVSSFLFSMMYSSNSSVGLIEGIMKDVEGEVKKAFNPSHFGKWGKHYIPLLKDAHVFEYPNNFKDISIQRYASKILDNNRDSACKIFENTPLIPTGFISGSGSSPSVARRMDTSRFGRDAGCFHGESTVDIIDPFTDIRAPGEYDIGLCLKKTIKVEDVRPGDKVYCGNGKFSIIEKILVTRIHSGFLDMVTIDCGSKGKWIGTPNHPININYKWIHPKKIGSIVTKVCTATYSFLFKDRNPSLFVNGIESLSLAHGLKGDVVEHNFFGEEKIVKSMEVIESIMGYHNIVTVEQNWFYRNDQGLIDGIHPYSDNIGLEDLLYTKNWHILYREYHK